MKNKKYKLLKWFPTLPRDWEVGMELGVGGVNHYGNYSPCHCKYSDYYVAPNIVENNSEFFEEIIQKECEILSLCGLISNVPHFVDKNGNILTFNQQSICERGPAEKVVLKKPDRWKIHSIRRLSDNEVFSIGDTVQSIRSNWQGNDCKIEIIRAKEDGTIDFTINQNGDKGTYRNCLNNFRKVKTPLFLTEDGIEIFEGDYYCHTTLDFQILGSKAGNLSGNLLGKKGYYYFSTEDKAQEWIILNKPMLSIKDIQPIIGKNLEYRNGGSYLDLDKLTKKFKELVKSKL